MSRIQCTTCITYSICKADLDTRLRRCTATLIAKPYLARRMWSQTATALVRARCDTCICKIGSALRVRNWRLAPAIREFRVRTPPLRQRAIDRGGAADALRPSHPQPCGPSRSRGRSRRRRSARSACKGSPRSPRARFRWLCVSGKHEQDHAYSLYTSNVRCLRREQSNGMRRFQHGACIHTMHRL